MTNAVFTVLEASLEGKGEFFLHDILKSVGITLNQHMSKFFLWSEEPIPK